MIHSLNTDVVTTKHIYWCTFCFPSVYKYNVFSFNLAGSLELDISLIISEHSLSCSSKNYSLNFTFTFRLILSVSLSLLFTIKSVVIFFVRSTAKLNFF